MRTWRLGSLLLAFTTVLAACPTPIKTVLIRSREEPVRGVRYTLLRPTFEVGVRVPASFVQRENGVEAEEGEESVPEGEEKADSPKPEKVFFEVLSNYPEIHIPKGPLFGEARVLKAETDGKTDLEEKERCVKGRLAPSESCKKECEGSSRPEEDCRKECENDRELCKAAYTGICVFPPAGSSSQGSEAGDGPEWMEVEVVLRDALKKERIYEVRGAPWYRWPLHSFSDTEIAVVLDKEGRLASLTAGEKDRSLEFVQAVAGLALKAAAPLPAPTPALPFPPVEKPGEVCSLLPTAPGFAKYATRHQALRASISELQARIARTRSSLENPDPVKQKAALEVLSTLEARLTAAQKKEKELFHPLHKAVYRLEVSRPGTTPKVINAGLPSPIFTITLEGK